MHHNISINDIAHDNKKNIHLSIGFKCGCYTCNLFISFFDSMK